MLVWWISELNNKNGGPPKCGPFITTTKCRGEWKTQSEAQNSSGSYLTTLIVIICCPLIMNCEGGSSCSARVATDSGVYPPEVRFEPSVASIDGGSTGISSLLTIAPVPARITRTYRRLFLFSLLIARTS